MPDIEQLKLDREVLTKQHDALPVTRWVERTRLLVLIQTINIDISKLKRDAR